MAWTYDIGVQKNYTHEEQINNATEFYNYFTNYGATLEAICGMLGNITQESKLNPGNKQTASSSSGWGLIQWTPSTVLTNWCSDNGYAWYDGTAQCERIVAEGERNRGASGYWLPTTSYPYSWEEFIALTDVHEATYAYLKERERAGDEAIELRLQYADEWYEYFSGSPIPPTPPTPPTYEEKHIPVWLMLKLY